jgi:hypothetical protein
MSSDGRLLRFLGGRHRLAIAQALKVPAVPVELRLVHLDWLAAEVDRRKRAPAGALKDWARAVSLAADSGNAPIAERLRRDAAD